MRVVGPDVETDAGLNDAEAPAGRPVTPNVTRPVNPVTGFTVAVNAALPPCVTDCDAGVADSEKSVTVIVRVAAWLVRPPLSVAVNDAPDTCRESST